jgi:pimeloyl-ACP methyl ester carboxylesterase
MTCHGMFGAALLWVCLDQPPSVATVGNARGEWVDPSPHRSGVAKVNGLALHYLDWGGAGEPLLLLAGLFGSAHAFDDLAPRLTGTHRVIALTRRGHGRSDAPPTGYGLDLLVEDIKGLLDALHLDRVHVAGVSAGGVEAAVLAIRHPDRVARVVYLDSAYDRSAAFQRKWASRLALNPVRVSRLPFPPAEARTSFAAFRRWYESAIGPWSPAVEADCREMYLDDAGRVKGLPASMTVAQELIASGTASPPDYAAVKAPALGVFAVPGYRDLPEGLDAEQLRRARAFHDEVTLPMQREQIESLRASVPGIAILELADTTHTRFMSEKLNDIGAALRDFLKRTP